MQEHKFVEKLEKLRENSAMLAICKPEEKTAGKIHDLVEKLFKKISEGEYNKVSNADMKSLMEKRGFKPKEKNVPKIIESVVREIADLLNNDKDGIKNVTTIFKNNGVHIEIDKTTLKAVGQIAKKIIELL